MKLKCVLTLKTMLTRMVVLIVLLGATHVTLAQSDTYIVAAHERDFIARFIFSTIEKQSNFSFQYADYPVFGERLDAVEDGKIDFVANITYTKSRASRFIFSEPINIEPTYLFNKGGESFDEMHVIGTTMGTAFNDIIQRYYPDKRVLGFNDNDVAFESLLAGNIDGYIGTFLQLESFLSAGFKATSINDQVSIPPVSIITNKQQNKPLLAAFSDIIAKDSVQKEIRRYIDSYITEIAIKQLRHKVNSSGLDLDSIIEIYLNPRPPYVFSGANGQPEGISVEFAKQICKLNQLKCRMVYDPTESWSASLQKLTLGERDVTTPIADIKHRQRILNFSRPYASIHGAIAKRVGYKEEVYRHISELFAEKVGVVENDVFASITRRSLPNKTLVYYSNTEKLINALTTGEVDYAITSQVTLDTLLYEHNITNVTQDRYFRPFYQSELSFGFPKTERGEILAQLFNRTLDFIDANSINRRYQPPANWRELNEKESDKRRLNIINTLLALLVLVTFFFGYITNHRANHDALTKLKNRHALNRIRKQALEKGHGLIYIDLNRFKHINDTYGHTVGDQVLRCYAKRLKETIDGQIYRIGGDEFVAITEFDPNELRTILDQLESYPFIVRGSGVVLTLYASVGVFLPDTSELSIKQLLIYTDFAMYEAKRNDKIRSVIIDEAKLRDLAIVHDPKKRSHRDVHKG
ncbi:transporter substrate-binding domain-containing diguanylate cyclase [Vibrio sp. McD22-P3]|uniref:transporter substrate-binding domain-containing diguanylate cyclase n=1 Tax=Vibrio sp. McD22-P3 TaxID=2724880 RepID=UPI001F21B87D|nr:GGDEF domain-containing protein [Vibrio sp. McD22-P3]MCF4173385.1 GGDEF domain-containing protein [Vibrio sp. McD22-P3]